MQKETTAPEYHSVPKMLNSIRKQFKYPSMCCSVVFLVHVKQKSWRCMYATAVECISHCSSRMYCLYALQQL